MWTRGRVLLALALPLAAAACSGVRGDEPTAAVAPSAVQVGGEDVVTVRSGAIVIGPRISGELRAANQATVRAELGGQILEVASPEEGEAVRAGALLARISVRALEDVRRSARSAVASAENQLAVARRETERTEQLVAAGALAQREVDIARSNVAVAEAQLEEARSRLASAETQLADAVVRAPISGVVSRRSVNVGDVVSPGTELFTIIEPSSMRLEASVPSDDLRALKVGAVVQFQVRGYEEPFEGRIERIAPQTEEATRQVRIFVTVPNTGGRLVSGLFAEGRVVTEAAEGLLVPLNAVNAGDGAPWVLRVADGRTERVEVTLGLRDARTEQLQITAGVSEGDVLLRGAAQGITPGTAVQVGGSR